MSQPLSQKQDILRFRGCTQFRQRIVFATLAHRKLRIDGIRDKDEAPGLRDFEANFLRLIEKLTNGCRIEINETGTMLKYSPGWITGGSFEHDCGTGRSIGWFLEGILPLMPFGKKAVNAVFTGITNDDADLTVDMIKSIHLPTMTHFGVSEGLKLDILARGCPPLGGGRVTLSCPVVRELKAISLTDEGFIKRIRGLTYSCKVSPHMDNRIVEAARGVLNPLLADVYVYTDHKKGETSGLSPGYGVSLIAASTSGCVYGAQRCTGMAKGLQDAGLGLSSTPLPPEELGRAAAESLLSQIAQGGCIDEYTQPLVFTLMLMCPEDVSRVRVGKVSPAGVATLRLIREIWGVTYKLKAEQQSAAQVPHVPAGKRRKGADGQAEGTQEQAEEEDQATDAALGKGGGKKRKNGMAMGGEGAVGPLLSAAARGGHSASTTVLISCLGIGFKNFAKKVT